MAFLLRARRLLGGSLSRSCSSNSISRPHSAAVTRHNFPEVLNQLKGHLRRADYVSIDMEMSGVHSSPWRRSIEIDTFETRYQNIRDSAEKFSLFQCGVCLFRYDTPTATFVAYPYNFYLFPRNELPFGTTQRDFLCQISSLEFLAKHKFDFNECIYNGISYLSRKQETVARTEMEKKVSKIGKEDDDAMSLKRTSDVLYCERVRLEVGLWRTAKIMAKDGRKSDLTTERESKELAQFPSLLVNVSDLRQAQLVVYAVNKNFDDLIPIFEDTGADSKQVKVLYIGAKDQRAAVEADLQKSKAKQKEALLKDSIGFRHVIDAIAESKKPVVGHNCILDFAHLHSKFIGPLPEKYSSFCSSIHELFPCILDTKYMLKADKLVQTLGIPSSSLSSVFDFFFEVSSSKKHTRKIFPRVKVEIADDFHNYSGTKLKHEAGYDAYMTGAIFAQMWRILGRDQTLSDQIKSKQLSFKTHENLLYMGWAGHYVLDIATGQEATGAKVLQERASYPVYRSAVVWSTVWSDNLMRSVRHLKKLVKNILVETGTKGEFEMIQVDDHSAFLVFGSSASLEEFMAAFENNEPDAKQKAVVTRLAEAGLKVARFETYEKLCKSQISATTLSDAIEMLKHVSEDEDDMEIGERPTGILTDDEDGEENATLRG